MRLEDVSFVHLPVQDYLGLLRTLMGLRLDNSPEPQRP